MALVVETREPVGASPKLLALREAHLPQPLGEKCGPVEKARLALDVGWALDLVHPLGRREDEHDAHGYSPSRWRVTTLSCALVTPQSRRYALIEP